MTVNTQELRELVEKATRGPWDVRYDYVVQATSFESGRLVPVAQPYGVNGDGSDLFANSRLIAAARNALPALLAENDALRTLLDHPLIRDVLGYVEDAGPADVWGAAQAWMALRDQAPAPPLGDGA